MSKDKVSKVPFDNNISKRVIKDAQIVKLSFNLLHLSILVGGNIYKGATKEEIDKDAYFPKRSCPIFGQKPYDPAIKGRYSVLRGSERGSEVLQVYYEWEGKKEEKSDPEYYRMTQDNEVFSLKIPSTGDIFRYHSATGKHDVPLLMKKCLSYVIECFQEQGFKVVYADTDLLFVQYGFKSNLTLERVKILTKKVSKDIRDALPIEVKHLELTIRERIKHAYFISKKNYITVSTDGKLKIAGEKIMHHDVLPLTKKICEEILKPGFKQGKFTYTYTELRQTSIRIFEEDGYTVMCRTYRVKSINNYKKSSSLQAKISNRYGEGEHKLIPNTIFGEESKGKGRDRLFLPTVEEFGTYYKTNGKSLRVTDFDIVSVIKNLKPFLKDSESETWKEEVLQSRKKN